MGTIQEALEGVDQFTIKVVAQAPGLADEDIIAACITSYVPGEAGADAEQGVVAVAVTEQRVLQAIWKSSRNTQDWIVHHLPLRSLSRATVRKHVSGKRIDQLSISIDCWMDVDSDPIVYQLPTAMPVIELYGDRKALGDAFMNVVNEIARRV